MLKIRNKRIANDHAAAARTVARIEASVVALSDDDLLDLADIFSGGAATPLGDMASGEMARRVIAL